MADLEDTRTRGEDLDFNYRLATAIAPNTCLGCERYHVNYTLGRLTGVTSPYGSDTSQFASCIERFAEARAESNDPVSITVVGSADTGLLAIVAHLAAKTGLIDRAAFHVIDRCATPLRLCREYGKRHGLRLTTTEADVSRSDPGIPADLIVLHSLLRFFAEEARLKCLRDCRSHLKAGGRVVVSNTFSNTPDPENYNATTEPLRKLVDQDAFTLAEPKARFLARLDQPSPWKISTVSRAHLLSLFDAAGLAAHSIETIPSEEAERGRLVAVLAAA